MKKVIYFFAAIMLLTVASCDTTTPEPELKKNPKSAVFSKLRVTFFPVLDNGNLWDALNGPDIYFTLEVKGGAKPNTYKFNNPVQNVDSSAPIGFIFDFTVNASDFDKLIYINLYDEDDFDDDDLIGFCTFKLNDYNLTYPTKVLATGTIAIEMETTWIY